MSTLTVTSKGQVTFRKDVLDHLGVQPGQRISVDKLPDGRVVVSAEHAGEAAAPVRADAHQIGVEVLRRGDDFGRGRPDPHHGPRVQSFQLLRSDQVRQAGFAGLGEIGQVGQSGPAAQAGQGE